MGCTCIFICELSEYFISAKMFVFKKKKGEVFLMRTVDGWLHFKWDVPVCFYSFWPFLFLVFSTLSG